MSSEIESKRVDHNFYLCSYFYFGKYGCYIAFSLPTNAYSDCDEQFIC